MNIRHYLIRLLGGIPQDQHADACKHYQHYGEYIVAYRLLQDILVGYKPCINKRELEVMVERSSKRYNNGVYWHRRKYNLKRDKFPETR